MDHLKNKLNNSKKYDKYLLYLVILSFALLPLIPNKHKGIPVLLLVVITLYSVIFTKGIIKKANFKYALIFSSLFILYAISLLYTDDVRYGLKKIETGASFCLIPLCFSIIYSKFKNLFLDRSLFVNVFILSSSVYAASIIYYFNYLGFNYCRENLSHCLSYLDGMFVLSEHPIYGSMFVAIGIIFIINTYKNQKTLIKVLFFIGLIVNTYVLLLLVRKGVIIALACSFFAFLFNFKKIKKFNYKNAIILFVVLFVLAFNFKDAIKSRFSELGNTFSYEKIDETNSTSIRYAVYKCAVTVAQKNILFGQGIGDVSKSLVDCYKGKSEFLLLNKFNSHNQYLGILLSVGLLGLCIFIYILYLFFKIAIKNKDINYIQFLLFFSTLFLTENILERHSGLITFYFMAIYFYYYNLKKVETN